MATEEEILAEVEKLGRLAPEQEDILYNISLKQDELGRQATNMLVEKIVGNPLYQDMLDREYLTLRGVQPRRQARDRVLVRDAQGAALLHHLRRRALEASQAQSRRRSVGLGRRGVTTFSKDPLLRERILFIASNEYNSSEIIDCPRLRAQRSRGVVDEVCWHGCVVAEYG